MVVEDNAGLAYSIGWLLEKAGYRVAVFTDATHAWDDLKIQGLHLLITDLLMPGGPNGIALAAHAGRLHRGLPIIYMTADADAAHHAGGHANCAVLLKPVSEEVLIKCVTALAPLPA
jgi:CheY-like chemotaxis protein